jgi:MFS family permease
MATHVEPARPETDTGRLDGASPLRIWSIVIVAVLFAEIAPLQYTMISAAVPKIAPTFPSAGANISWMITIFALVAAVVTPICGKMSDLWGKKRLLIACGVVFIVGSALCALTSSWGLFLLGRGLEALATAAATVTYGLFRDILPRRYIPMAVGVVATGFGVSAVAAPLLGGWMLNHFSWRSLFWALAIYTVITLAALWAIVPESKLRAKQRIDLAGVVTMSGGVTGILLYISEGGNWGWTNGTSLAYLIGGLILLAAFVLIERRVAQPIMDMKLLMAPKVAMTLAASCCASYVIATAAYALPYMAESPSKAQLVASMKAAAVQKGLPASALPMLHISFPSGTLAFAGGLTLLAFAWRVAIFQGITAMFTGPLTGAWSRRTGARKPLISGLAFLLATAGLLLVLPLQGLWGLAVATVVMGIGFGFFYGAAPNLIMEATPPEQQGITTGMWSLVGAISTAVATAILTAFFVANPVKVKATFPGRPSTVTTLNQVNAWAGYRDGFYVAIGVAAVGLIFAVLMKHGRTPSTGGAASETESAPVTTSAVSA